MHSSTDGDLGDSVSVAEPPARRPGVTWYLREVVAIARFDHDAIHRTADDPRALRYGALFTCAAAGATLLGQRQALGGQLDDLSSFAQGIAWVLTLGFVAIAHLCLSAMRVALLHGAAKLLFGATGRYVRLLRVVWLGTIVQVLAIVPVIGVLVGVVWALIITLVTVEEVEGIERLQALVLVVIIGVLNLFVNALFGLM